MSMPNAVAALLVAVLQCSSPKPSFAFLVPLTDPPDRNAWNHYVVCPPSASGRKAILSSRLLATSRRRGDAKAPAVDDAARLYQALASREAKRRRTPGGRRPRLHPKNDTAAAASEDRGDDERQGGGVSRLRLQRFEVEGSRPPSKTLTKTKLNEIRRKETDAEVDRRTKMETELSRLKLTLAEAKREADEGERRAEEAERRADILSEGLASPPPPAPENGRAADTIGSVRQENVALTKKVESDNRRRLREFDAAAGTEKRALRNRAWSVETELNKQQMLSVAARKEADAATALKNDVEARFFELEERYCSRVEALENEVEGGRALLVRTRRKIALKYLSMRSAFRSDIQRRREDARAKEETVRADVVSKIRAIEEDSEKKLLVLRRETVDAIATEKKEKFDALRTMREEYDSYGVEIEGQIRIAKESAEEHIWAVRQETDRKLENSCNVSKEEKITIRKEGERALAEATSEAVRHIDRIRKEVDQKLEAEESDRDQLWEELAGRQTAMANFEQERSSLGKVAQLVRDVVKKRLRIRRRDS